jgi:hypothetical protein
MSAIASIPSYDMIGGSASVTATLAGSGLFLLGFLLMIVISVIANMGIANMAHTGKLGAAFRFGEILRIIGSIGWANTLSGVSLSSYRYCSQRLGYSWELFRL